MKNLPTYEEFLNESIVTDEERMWNIYLEETEEMLKTDPKKFVEGAKKFGFPKVAIMDALMSTLQMSEDDAQSMCESRQPLKLKVFVKEGEVHTIEIMSQMNEEDDEDEEEVLDIDIEIEDETGKSLDDDPEEEDPNYKEEDESVEEKARPPRLTKRQRKANNVKAQATKKVLGPDSPIRTQINKIFLLVKKEIKREASKQGVPIGQINLDRLTIKA